MKRYFILLSVMILALNAKSQDTVVYRSIFGDSLTRWEGVLAYTLQGVQPYSYSVYTADTAIIEGERYYLSINTIHNYCSSDDWLPYNDDKLYLRESERHDKLYGRLKLGSLQNIDEYLPEFLIMDLSLEAGDTLNTDSWADLNLHPNQHRPVIVIDSVYYRDGRKHLVTNFMGKLGEGWGHFVYDTLTFVEGVGPDIGIGYFLYALLPHIYRHFEAYQIYDSDSCWVLVPYINCCWHDTVFDYHREWVYYTLGVSRYTNEIICSYYEPGDAVDVVNDDRMKLYPNPVQDRLVVSDIPDGINKVSLKNMIGKEINCYSLDNETVSLSMYGLPSGVYFLVFGQEDGKGRIIKKIVKL